jgi:hypothetical protein
MRALRLAITFCLAVLASASAAHGAPPTSVSASATPSAMEAMPTVNGLYPLWEHTGEVHPWLHFQIGYNHAQLGLGPVQLGTQPVLDIYGIYNGQAKVAFRRKGKLRIAAELGWYQVPTNAQSRTIGNLHAVHLINPYESISLVPLSLAATWLPLRWLRVHGAATVLGQWASSTRNRQASVGVAALVEARASEHWAVMAHLGVEGIGVAAEEHVGASLVYRHQFVDLRAGYARRFADGESDNQFMFDVAVVF